MEYSEKHTPSLGAAVKQFKQLILLIKPYWGSLIKTVIPGPIIGFIDMAAPYLTKMLIDVVYPSNDVTFMHVLVGGILVLSVSSSLLKGVREYYSLYISTKLNNTIGLLFFNHLQHLPARFFEKHQVGEITSRFSDVNSALGTISHVFSTIFLQGFYLLLVPPFLFLLQWQLALVGLISVPFIIVVTTVAGKLMRKSWKETAEAYADYSAFQVEILSQIRSLKTMALEHFVYKKSKSKVEHAFKKNLKSEGVSQLLGIINSVMHVLNTVLFTWLGWTFILAHEMTLGDYIAFTMYIGYLYSPFNQLVFLFSSFQHSAINLNRMFEYLESKPEQAPELAYVPYPSIKHEVKGGFEFKNVNFSYTGNEKILTDITFEIEPGSIFAVIGESGSGKTTLLKLMTSMEKPGSGKIYLDNIPLNKISLADLRRQMSVVWQDFSLFKGTIWENLTFGHDQVSKKTVDEIVGLCRLEKLITTLPNSYDTQVAEWGATLSGGQKQRIAIARSLIRNSPVVILDEPTSNIDVKTESELVQELFRHCRNQNKTVIMVTHRLNSIVHADKIGILEAGCLTGFGTHQELLKENNDYKQMFTITPVNDEVTAGQNL